jgi:hypothetical protein
MATKPRKLLRTKKRLVAKFRSLYIAVQPVGSKFAKALQTALRNKVINNIFRVDHRKGSEHERLGRSLFRITTEPLDKIQQLQRFKAKSVSCPAFCTAPEGVRELGSKVVFARTLVNSTNGKGIVEFELRDDVSPPRAPLYTAYIPKKAEYRVHVFDGKVVDTQQKRKKKEFAGDRDTRIRNLGNGYVYCRDGISQSQTRDDLAVSAVASLNYRYGAVDIIYNEKQDKYFVLEVNSRPGLMGTTLEKYADALINTFNLTTK